ncbi:MAG: arginine--tRNA ligase [Pirellulales bacterium]|nr:arginine--tRNA ligase [Pirellulales bacterium]
MSILAELKSRLSGPLGKLVEDPAELLEMVRPSQDPKFGDYQANFAMPLGKQLGRPPRDVAAEIVAGLDVGDLCEPPEIAGPGFINLRVKDDRLVDRLAEAAVDPRLGVPEVESPRRFVIDFSAPNVAKPMHVGHIRSTVIGDALCRLFRFLGHEVTSDNHIGDWGTQFGMILYGYRNFRDPSAYDAAPVAELARLYRLVRQLMDYHEGKAQLPQLGERLEQREAALADQLAAAGDTPDKKTAKALRKAENDLTESRKEIEQLEAKLAAVEADPVLSKMAIEHAGIGEAVLAETAKLHAGDAENRRLWEEFLPHCLDEINRVYGRLNVTFDHTLGESFYQDRLAATVDDLIKRGIATTSDGAICVFLEGQNVPMLIRKQDGAFLYATTDLATLGYRMETFQPDAILYVVDHRQAMHFEHLFATARLMGMEGVRLEHVSFGTVLGGDGRPFKTRSGDTVGLEGLLDEAVRRAATIVAENDDAKPKGAELSAEERAAIAERVGIAALKYADLSQNRTSDYVFSYDKMLAMNGNTATYMQYAYARVRSIFAKGDVDVEALRAAPPAIDLSTPAERALGLAILRFGEALDLAALDYRPNQLTAYLFDLAACYSTFFEQCPVLKAPTDALRQSRLLLCDLTARVIRKGLELLGIEVVERM